MFALTHVYCHHQEVVLVNLSAELNSFLPARISSCEEQKHKQRLQRPRNSVAFQPAPQQNISVFAQKQRPNRTQVVFSTKALFDSNITVVF